MLTRIGVSPLRLWRPCVRTQLRRLAVASAKPQSIEVMGTSYRTDDYTNITPAITSKLLAKLYSQPAHPICTLKQLIESHFPDYAHLSSFPPVVSPAKNFDDLSFAADHPGRSVTDSYYINRDAMLRTHTSAHEVEVFAKGHERFLLTADVYRRDEIDASHYPIFHQMEGACLFSADAAGNAELEEDNERQRRALRKENIEVEDKTEISESNPYQKIHDPKQARLVTENLKHSLNSLLLKLFARAAGVSKENPLRVRWIEAFFPFTTPSYEVEVLFQGKWLEILGCGVVQQSTLDRASTLRRADNQNFVCLMSRSADAQGKLGWAFGLGLERIAMILYSIPDIRLFWSQDPRFLEQFEAGKLSTFKPYSKYPACYKDISFWLPQNGLHENDFCDLVRATAGDLVESVQMVRDNHDYS